MLEITVISHSEIIWLASVQMFKRQRSGHEPVFLTLRGEVKDVLTILRHLAETRCSDCKLMNVSQNRFNASFCQEKQNLFLT